MSTGLNCAFIEVQPSCWYYLLEDWDTDDTDDWRLNASAYGPFNSENEASAHLSHWHANPGMASIQTYEPGYEPDEVLADLIQRAQH
ncbi:MULTISPECIES: hypothetical protein [unclassified Nocardia]|uniref:hypothetical protein n=1 Tax=unclassified Nocardia TaxID=2637762 RepID=UPI001CE3BDA1|nr:MULTISPECIES: hypothetical protein [unclassified Nocardia]